MRKFIIVTTCKGRLEHIKQAAPTVVQAIKNRPNWQWLVVDYDCPDGTRHWLTEHYPDVVVVGIDKAPKFNKPTALNVGAASAFGHLGANYVVFQDADTLVKDPELYDWVEDNVAPDNFLIYPADQVTRDLTGFLVVGRKAFVDSQGFDVAFDSWGAEDLEYRLRLYLLLGYFFDEVPEGSLDSIPHSDELRSQFYDKKDVDVTNWDGLDMLVQKFSRLTGRTLQEMTCGADGRYILRLLGTMPDVADGLQIHRSRQQLPSGHGSRTIGASS